MTYSFIHISEISNLFKNSLLNHFTHVNHKHPAGRVVVRCSNPETMDEAGHTLTLALPIFGAVSPSCGWDKAQLAAQHIGVGYWKVVITDGSPLSTVKKLYSTLVVFSGVASQSDL